MSHMPRLTLIGMYNYDSDLFHDFTLPTGIDKDKAVNSLLLKYGEKPVLYMDTTFMKYAIKAWAEKWSDSFANINEALTAEYNKIHNFDRNEEYTDTGKDVYAVDMTDTYESDTKTTTTDGTSTENKVSAYNDATYQPSTKSENSGDLETEGEADSKNTHKGGDQKDTKLQHYGHLYGNIGVTTSQQMITEEMKLRTSYNIYDVIADAFSNELLLYTY